VVKVIYDTGTRTIKRMDAGEVFDVVVATTESLKDFRAAGKVEAGGVNIGRVGTGIMVRPGAWVPDISSAEALKRSILDADSVLYTSATSGLYIEGMLKKMGIYEQAKTKTTLYATGPQTMDHVLRGKGKEFGFLPITAILTYKEKGVVLVGPLPKEVQYYVELIAQPSTKSTNKDVAWEFVRYCAGSGKSLLVANGIN
jgi:molybdate transport system substrate-binding protein